MTFDQLGFLSWELILEGTFPPLLFPMLSGFTCRESPSARTGEQHSGRNAFQVTVRELLIILILSQYGSS